MTGTPRLRADHEGSEVQLQVPRAYERRVCGWLDPAGRGGRSSSGSTTPPKSILTLSSVVLRGCRIRLSSPTTGKTRLQSASNARSTLASIAEVNTPFHG